MRIGMVTLFPVFMLSACGGGGGGGSAPDDLLSSRASITTVDEFIDGAELFVDNVLKIIERPEATNLPVSGSATYNGKIGADYSGDAIGSVLGDMSMTAQFNDSTVSGTINELIATDGVDVYEVGGELLIDGDFAGADLYADATGRLGIPNAAGNSVASDVELQMYGVFLGPPGTPNAVAGVFEGGTVSGVGIAIDEGIFYGTN